MKTALVTGTSSGFGKSLVGLLLSDGWKVLAGLRQAEERRGLFARELDLYPQALTLLDLDVADARSRSRAAAAAGGALDCLVNNAGFGLTGSLEDMSEEQLRRQMEVNFFGAAFLTRELLPALRQARGRVINVSSVLGYSAFPLTGAYCASKFALEGLSEALYHELKPLGVQVCLVEPGGFRTKMADNQVWGEASLKEDSPYAPQTRAMLRFREKMLSKPGKSPEIVAREIARLAGASRMPLRNPVGADARGERLLQRFLPLEAGARIKSAVFGRLFK